MKMIFGIVVIVAVIYAGVMVIPPYMNNYQFADAIKNEATVSTYTTRTEEEIRATVYKKAQEYDIPITQDKIKVHRGGTQGGSLSIDAPYTVHVNLVMFPLDLNFDPSTQNKSVF